MTVIDSIDTQLHLAYQMTIYLDDHPHAQAPLRVTCPFGTLHHRNLGDLHFPRDHFWTTHCLRRTILLSILGMSLRYGLDISPVTVFMISRLASFHELGSLPFQNHVAFGTHGLVPLEDAVGELQDCVVLVLQQTSVHSIKIGSSSNLSEGRQSRGLNGLFDSRTTLDYLAWDFGLDIMSDICEVGSARDLHKIAMAFVILPFGYFV